MAGRWFRRDSRDVGGGSTDVLARARNDMVTGFLELDQRLSILADGVDAAAALGLSPDLLRSFAPIRDDCYETINQYLALSDPDATASLADYQRISEQITKSISRLDRFYEQNSTQIEHARTAYGAIPDEAVRVRQEAERLAEKLGDLTASQLGYGSVKTAVAQYDQARNRLESAQLQVSQGGDRVELQASTSAMRAAIEKLETAIAEAPSKDGQARAALASVRTRLAAVRNRSTRMPEAYSALLREFSAACSADLVGHDQRSAADLERAEAEIDTAASTIASDPEQSLAAITRARAVLAEAEELVDGVTDRLNELRVVRADPPAAAGRVRFQIRDAQLLAVNLGLVKQWGSVLDAQVLRVDRAVAALTGRHPDYWGYLVDLRTISDFVTGVVNKMKDEARR